MEALDSDVVQAITTYLAAQQEIRLVILFGSFANGQPQRDSDLDVAIVCTAPLCAQRRMELMGELAQLSGRAIDLVDLATAGVATKRSVLRHGQILFSRDDSVYPEQISRMLLDSADFLPYRNRILRERRKAWIG